MNKKNPHYSLRKYLMRSWSIVYLQQKYVVYCFFLVKFEFGTDWMTDRPTQRLTAQSIHHQSVIVSSAPQDRIMHVNLNGITLWLMQSTRTKISRYEMHARIHTVKFHTNWTNVNINNRNESNLIRFVYFFFAMRYFWYLSNIIGSTVAEFTQILLFAIK